MTRAIILVLGCLFGLLIAISAIYVAIPALRLFFYVTLIGIPFAYFLDYTFFAAPYLIGAWSVAFVLNALWPRLPGAVVILAPFIAICGWHYVHANTLNAERRAAADEALALVEAAPAGEIDISRLSLMVGRTDCDLTCQRLLVSETVEQVLLFENDIDDLTLEGLTAIPAVVWRLEERATCPTPRLSRPNTSRMTEADQDFAVSVQALLWNGQCIFEEPGTLAAATAIIHRTTVQSDGFRGQRVRLLTVDENQLREAYAIGGGTLSEVRHPAIRIYFPSGNFDGVRRGYRTNRVRYGANQDALSDEVVLQAAMDIDLDAISLVSGDDFSRPALLLGSVRAADDPNDNALRGAISDYATAFAGDVERPSPVDLELVLAVLENSNSPVPRNLSNMIVPSDGIPESILDEIAEAAWVRIEAARQDEWATVDVFKALPDPIIASYRESLFNFAAKPIQQRSSIRVLTTLLMFGEEGALTFADLLNRISEEEDRVIANTIYNTVFEALCDRPDVRPSALRESILQSIQSGQLDNYEWTRSRDVIGLLAALDVEATTIFQLGSAHGRHYREERTQSTLDFVIGRQHCLEQAE